MATATQTGRVTRRWHCAGCGIDLGQTQIPATPGQESVWVPIRCRICEAKLRRELQAAEEAAAQVDEIRAEADHRCAADTGRIERIRQAASEDLAQEAIKMIDEFYATHREARETFRDDEDWARVAAEVEAEFLARIRAERG
jgi:hypothetical protein